MFHDSDFLPFTPREKPSFLAVTRNFLENYSPQAYRAQYWTSERLFGIVPRMHYVTSPEMIEEVLVSRADAFRRDDITSNALAGPIERETLFFTDGVEWKWQRRALAPAFRHENLLALVPDFVRCAQARAEQWRALEQGAVIDAMAAMSGTTFSVIEKAVFGASDDFDSARFVSALRPVLGGVGWRMLGAMFRLPADRIPYPGVFAARRAARVLREMTEELLAQRRASGDSRRDILGLLLAAKDPESGRVLTDDELIANLHGLLLAGHETAAVALGWSLWLLAKDQQSQQRVREEVARLCGDDDIGPGTVESLAFTRQILQEAMRLFPPAAAIGRQARADTTLGAHRVRANEPIYVLTWCLHRNENLWDEPLGFDPDRFTPDKIKARHRYAYLPFGAGPRICIGMGFAMLEMSAILATLVREFHLETVAGHKLELAPSLTTRPKGPLPLRLTRLARAVAGARDEAGQLPA